MRRAIPVGSGARPFGGPGMFRPLIYGLILASAAAQFALIPVMPVYAHRLGLSGFQQGMVLGATGLAALAVSVPAGTLSDRFGARRITLAAGLLMAAATLAQALAGNFPALLVPAQLHAAGASPGQIGLVFAAAGILFAAGSALTAAAGRRAVNLLVICGGMLVLTVALSLGVLSTAPLVIIVMLCIATAARSVLWTVSYPLAADAAGRSGTGLGAAVGLLNGVWAATAVVGPLAAGLAAEHLGARGAFGLTEAACAAALAVAAAAAWPARRPARTEPGRDLADGRVLLQNGPRQHDSPS